MGKILLSSRRLGLLAGVLLWTLWPTVHAEELILTVSEPAGRADAGGAAGFWLNALNPSTEGQSWSAPAEIQCRLQAAQGVVPVSARLRDARQTNVLIIAPGAFARREYRFQPPAGFTGEVAVTWSEPGLTRLTLHLPPAPSDAGNTPATPQSKGMVYFLKGREHSATAGDYDPDDFFKEHIFGYEPFYFIAGSKSPNAKFQISFKYRLVNEHGWLARQAPWTKGFHMAYSQTSLWDWNAPSAPFFDSSYRPELLYSWDRLFGGRPTNWFRMDFQGGLQHESNGRDGADSRSLNIAYLRPRFTLGPDTGFQVSLIPRAWIYVGDLSDNPDIQDYRGYADLRGILGWKRGLQLSALGRIGDDGEHASGQFDLTYPLMQSPSGSFSVYLHVQYFTGYGESLLGYKEKTDILRAGFSLYR